MNFYNQNDWALAPDIWEFNQITKPDYRDLPHQPNFYYYRGDPNRPAASGLFQREERRNVNSYVNLDLGSRSDVRDRYEIMSFAAEARTRALGRTPTLIGVDLQSSEIWPQDTSPNQRNGPFGAHKWHSAQFRSTNMRQKGYWRALLGAEGFNIQQTTP